MGIFDEDFMSNIANKTLHTASDALDALDKKLKESEVNKKQEDKSIKSSIESKEEVQNDGDYNTDYMDWNYIFNGIFEDKDNKEENSKDTTTNSTDSILNRENMKKFFNGTKRAAGKVIDGTKETYQKIKKVDDTRKKVNETINNTKERSIKVVSFLNEKIMNVVDDQSDNFNEVRQLQDPNERLNNLKLNILLKIENLLKSDEDNLEIKLKSEFEKLDNIKELEKMFKELSDEKVKVKK